MKSRILIVAAHPDDEILGCGATVSKLIKQGCEAYSLILGEGKTARDNERNKEKRSEDISALKEEAEKANKVLGIKKLFMEDFPDNRFDDVALLDIIKAVERVKAEVQPDIIFTHYEHDLNIDHRVTYNAVITAARPMVGESVKEIYAFENISSTEWKYPITFSPNTFFDVSDHIDQKIKSLKEYESEMRGFPHPRSIEGVELVAKNWGMKLGVGSAEAFLAVRITK